MSTSTLTAEDLAAELRKIPLDMRGWAETLLSRCAEKFEIVHVPPIAADGMVDAAEYLNFEMSVLPEVLKVIPDLRRQVGTISVSGNVVTFTHAAVGTRPDGTPLRLEGVYILTVENGKIVKIHDWHDPEEVQAFMKLIPSVAQLLETTEQ